MKSGYIAYFCNYATSKDRTDVINRLKNIKAFGFKPLISFSIALPMTLISPLKVSMQLKELAIDTFKGS